MTFPDETPDESPDETPDAAPDTTPDAQQVLALAAAADAADGVAPLSEAFLLALSGGDPATTHLERTDGGGLTAYAQVDPDGVAELVVHPAARRQGLARALWTEARAHGARSVWAHGDLAAARAAADAFGLVRVRELHRMERQLHDADLEPAVLPAGYTARTFVPGADDEAWLALNAAAFADHPEQGRMTLADLRDRVAQPWFDADGFFLVSADDDPATPIAFHWTKSSGMTGEVYVVGVHPSHQGRGLARSLTRLGTSHLARRGLPVVELYVDGDNAPALATYRRDGFASVAIDAMYAVGSGG